MGTSLRNNLRTGSASGGGGTFRNASNLGQMATSAYTAKSQISPPETPDLDMSSHSRQSSSELSSEIAPEIVVWTEDMQMDSSSENESDELSDVPMSADGEASDADDDIPTEAHQDGPLSLVESTSLSAFTELSDLSSLSSPASSSATTPIEPEDDIEVDAGIHEEVDDHVDVDLDEGVHDEDVHDEDVHDEDVHDEDVHDEDVPDEDIHDEVEAQTDADARVEAKAEIEVEPKVEPFTDLPVRPVRMPTKSTSFHDKIERLTFNTLPKSSIPADIPSYQYASECIAAAESSRLNPYALHPEEYHLVRHHISHAQVTTYLNIRNGILRLWMSHPWAGVTRQEAVGFANIRWFDAASVCFDWLVRRGYINYGCVEIARPQVKLPPSSPKQAKTIAVIGAGVSGLACARQLECLINQYALHFTEKGEEPPRVIVLEGRNRVGG